MLQLAINYPATRPELGLKVRFAFSKAFGSFAAFNRESWIYHSGEMGHECRWVGFLATFGVSRED